jgi:hypothetical protein
MMDPCQGHEPRHTWVSGSKCIRQGWDAVTGSITGIRNPWEGETKLAWPWSLCVVTAGVCPKAVHCLKSVCVLPTSPRDLLYSGPLQIPPLYSL